MRRIELDGARGRALHGEDLADDRFGRLGGLHRQRFDFRGDDGEAAAGLAGAGRFDGGVERQQIGLLGDGLNELDDVADLLRRIGKRRHFAVGRLRLIDRHAHDIVGLRDLPGDFGDRGRQFVGGVGRGFDAGRRLVRGFGGAGRAQRAVVCRSRQRHRGGFHRRRAVAEGLEQRFHRAAERRDRGVDHAAAFLLVGHVVALPLQQLLFSDVLVGRNPSAVGRRRVDGVDNAAVAGIDHEL